MNVLNFSDVLVVGKVSSLHVPPCRCGFGGCSMCRVMWPSCGCVSPEGGRTRLGYFGTNGPSRYDTDVVAVGVVPWTLVVWIAIKYKCATYVACELFWGGVCLVESLLSEYGKVGCLFVLCAAWGGFGRCT